MGALKKDHTYFVVKLINLDWMYFYLDFWLGPLKLNFSNSCFSVVAWSLFSVYIKHEPPSAEVQLLELIEIHKLNLKFWCCFSNLVNIFVDCNSLWWDYSIPLYWVIYTGFVSGCESCKCLKDLFLVLDENWYLITKNLNNYEETFRKIRIL